MINKQSDIQHFSELARQAVDNSSDIIFWLDPNAQFQYVNEAACLQYGYSREELLTKKMFVINPNFEQSSWSSFCEQIKAERVMQYESIHQTQSGTKLNVMVSLNWLSHENKEYICAIIRNITRRKQQEEILEKALLEVQLLKKQLEEENIYLQEEIRHSNNFAEIITQSDKYKKILNQIQQVAATDATVLILGETGTGKELLARAVHNLSGRSGRPLVKVNCAALPANLIESEIFGHEKGSFTGAISRKIGRFELADKGTLFLDEIGEMPIDLQSKLLRVLQEGEFERIGSTQTQKVDVRIIAATNQNVEKMISEGKFRQDLYYRLNVFPIINIPLRERKEDIQLLVQYFIKKFSDKMGKNITNIPKKVIDTFMNYSWPGNVRELENIVERAVIISNGMSLQIGNWLTQEKQAGRNNELDDNFITFEEMQKRHIVNALKRTKGRVSGDTGAAIILGLNPKTLESKMRKFQIKRGDFMV